MKDIEIKITGSGTSQNIADTLRMIANEIERGEHINGLNKVGTCEWEDNTLFTTITEADDEDEEQPVPLYPEPGKMVKTTLPCFEGPYEIVSWFWNGFTYMYSFRHTDMSCGEEYLRP